MSPLRRRLLFAAASLLVSLHFAMAYVTDAAPFLDLRAFAAGQAPLPFQERALTAWLLHASLRLDSPRLEWTIHRLWPAAGARADLLTLVVAGLAFASMLVALVSTRASLTYVTKSRLLASFGCFLVPFMAYFNYILSPDAHFLLPYDLPSLAFFCLAFYTLLSGRLGWYYPVFLLACLNRETALFLVAFFGVLEATRGRVQRPRLWAHLLAQVALWTGVKLWMHYLYGGNPVEAGSGLFQVKLLQNLGFLLKGQHWPALVSCFGFTLPLVVALRRRIPHVGLRRSLPILGAWFALMMVVGVIIEIRIFGELISYMSLVCVLLLEALFEPRRAAAA